MLPMDAIAGHTLQASVIVLPSGVIAESVGHVQIDEVLDI
jgi:hypothetical protein